MQHFLESPDAAGIQALLQLARKYQQDPWCDQLLGRRRRLGLLFLNPSLRTRLSTQLAASQLGMEPIVFNADKDGWALEFRDNVIMNGTTVEHIRDAAPVLGQYFDILGIRTFPGLVNQAEDYAETVMQQFIRHSGIPIVSLESATLHPLQSLADVMTIESNCKPGKRPKVVLAWGPHIKALPQCVANSFAQWVTNWGQADFTIAHPPGYELSPAFTKGATITHDLDQALEGADFVYVKNWSAWSDYGKVLCTDPAWMLTPAHLRHAPDSKIMHCLPVRRNLEISAELLDSPNSLVQIQAGNRVWAAQAVLSHLLHVNHLANPLS
jgi:N-succinyl-L-ornithine transcarbamylase